MKYWTINSMKEKPPWTRKKSFKPPTQSKRRMSIDIQRNNTVLFEDAEFTVKSEQGQKIG